MTHRGAGINFKPFPVWIESVKAKGENPLTLCERSSWRIAWFMVVGVRKSISNDFPVPFI